MVNVKEGIRSKSNIHANTTVPIHLQLSTNLVCRNKMHLIFMTICSLFTERAPEALPLRVRQHRGPTRAER